MIELRLDTSAILINSNVLSAPIKRKIHGFQSQIKFCIIFKIYLKIFGKFESTSTDKLILGKCN